MVMHPFVSLLLLTALSVGYSYATRPLERRRRALSHNKVPNLLAVWTCASVILLPSPYMIAAALAVFYLADWPSRAAAPNPHPWRFVYSWAANTAAAITAAAVLRRMPIAAGIPLALLVFTVIAISLVAIAMRIRRQFAALKMLRNPRSHMVEFATQLTGVALGITMEWHQALAVIALPVLLVTHRKATRDSVEDSGAYDPATRLWSEEGWEFQAGELIRTGAIVTVMVLDGDPGSGKAVLADAVRPWLVGGAVLGCYGASQIVTVSVTGSADMGRRTVGNAARALEQSGANYFLGGRTARREDVSEMLANALSDLMAARERAGVINPW